MTQETAWMDYTKPPPGLDVEDLPPSLRKTIKTAGVWGPNAVEAAWSYVRAHHDPLGAMRCGPLGLYATFGHGLPRFLSRPEIWAYHDRRRAIVLDIDEQTCSNGKHLAVWMSLAIAWTDAECAEVEAYAALPFPRGIDMPQALQRVLLPRGAHTS